MGYSIHTLSPIIQRPRSFIRIEAEGGANVRRGMGVDGMNRLACTVSKSGPTAVPPKSPLRAAIACRVLARIDRLIRKGINRRTHARRGSANSRRSRRFGDFLPRRQQDLKVSKSHLSRSRRTPRAPLFQEVIALRIDSSGELRRLIQTRNTKYHHWRSPCLALARRLANPPDPATGGSRRSGRGFTSRACRRSRD